MKITSHHLSVLNTIMLIVIVNEGLAALNLTAIGVAVENPWYRQWPFFSETSSEYAGTPQGFAYNGTHAELVIGIRARTEISPKLASMSTLDERPVMNQFAWPRGSRSFVISVPTGEIPAVLGELSSDQDVTYVEPNLKVYADATVNDKGWMLQWGPTKIEADKAWNVQKGSRGILVAVVDTGILYSHPDLGSSYVPLGLDWVNNDTDPIDDNGHGTHCAGIIAASLNNSIGIAGLAQVRIMAEKGLARNGAGYDDDLARAIVHAADQGANIISCSWGSDTESQLLHEAIQYATDSGALVIAAAGNTGASGRHYPAAYEEVIGVSATDENDRPATFTTYGDWVSLAAPGTSVYSTYLWNSYLSMSGTSMACPHVAGVAALIWSQYPAMSNAQVRKQLLSTADDLGVPGRDGFYGFGRVNALKAVEQTVALIGSGVLDAPADSVHFLQLNPSEGASAATAYDTIASGIIYGLTINRQKQEFASNSHIISEFGRLNASAIANGTVVLFGGPCPQKAVRYYEDAGMTPVKFGANETSYEFLTQGGRLIASMGRAAVDSGHEDMFVVEVLADGTNLVVVMYGFSWKGTWASGILFKESISKRLNSFAEQYYVFHWVDSQQLDGIPETSEIHQEAP